MYTNQHTNAAVSYNFNSTGGRQQRHIQIVDTNALPTMTESVSADFKGEPLETPASHQLVYGSTAPSSYPSGTVGQNIQVVPSVSSNLTTVSNDMFNASESVVPQGPSQNDLDIEPIDLEEVQKIQARMPAADPSAPVGSNKNPIRIIQQGNQYITTQDVSDEHLQQIIQVLTNQALLSSSGSRPSAIYNRLTNRRIIFRVTRAKRRHDENNTTISTTPSSERTRSNTAIRGGKKGRVGRPPGGKRRKRGSDEEDPDFEPEMPEEEVLPFPLIRRTSASGRVSKPPKHLVKDYKHLRLEDLTTKPESSDDDDHSDGGYSDYINDGLSDEGWSEDGTNKDLRWPCPMCNKVFSSRAGVARHRSIAHGPNRGRPRGRWANPYMASARRRAKLKEAISEATDDDLIEFVAPRLSKLVSPWDHLLMRSEQGNPPLPQVPRVVLDYLSLVERARAFLCDQLEPSSVKPHKTKKSQSNGNSTEKQNSSENTETVVANGEETTKDVENQDKGTIKSNKSNDVEINSNSKSQIKCAEKDLNCKKVNENDNNVEEDDDDEEDEDDTSDGAIIVKIESVEQSSALGLPCGKYTVREPLREEYLPRRFRSILAAQRAGAVPIIQDSNANKSIAGQQPKRAVVAMETAEDDEVDATLRSDVTSTEGSLQHFGDTMNSTQVGDNQSQSLMTLGEDLLLLPEGGLGCPVPDEWLASGAFLTVLTENGQTSDLVMEAATGRLFHRPTGHLVSLADNQQTNNQSAGDFQAESFEYEPATDQTSKYSNSVSPEKRKTPSKTHETLGKSDSNEEELNSEEVVSQQDQLLAQLAENGEVIDLNTLFPGVSVTEVSPGVCLVTKPNGDRFNVEHGGEGITLETLQTILQMDA